MREICTNLRNRLLTAVGLFPYPCLTFQSKRCATTMKKTSVLRMASGRDAPHHGINRTAP